MNLTAILRALLWPLSILYGAVARIRAGLYAKGWLPQKRLSAPVISVGNLTTGGTGKTPMVIWLAEKFLAEGKRVGILSRGYRGSGGTSDEIEIMKRRLSGAVRFGVGKDRYEQGRRLQQQGIDVFLLDDGFQHLQLARDCDIVLIDATRPLREQRLLPCGSLREPTSAVNRADLVFFTRTNHALGAARAILHVPQFPVFPANTKLIGFRRFGTDGNDVLSAEQAAGPFFAFCGIGNPQAFLRDLKEWRVPLVDRKTFRDHFSYAASDIASLEKSADAVGAKAFVTTEKDEQNLRGAKFSLPVYVAVIAMHIPVEDEVFGMVKTKIWPKQDVAA
jgi:tetraacyldisaccharide 4'-kinase